MGWCNIEPLFISKISKIYQTEFQSDIGKYNGQTDEREVITLCHPVYAGDITGRWLIPCIQTSMQVNIQGQVTLQNEWSCTEICHAQLDLACVPKFHCKNGSVTKMLNVLCSRNLVTQTNKASYIPPSNFVCWGM